MPILVPIAIAAWLFIALRRMQNEISQLRLEVQEAIRKRDGE